MDRAQLLYGHDATERIVAAEFIPPNRVAVFRRVSESAVTREDDAFQPWLVTGQAGLDLLRASRSAVSARRLAGGLPLCYLVSCESWARLAAVRDLLRERAVPYHALGNPVDQYLCVSGRTLFKGMGFDDLVRLQLDIEAAGLDASRDEAEILAVALSTNRGHQEVLHRGSLSEADLLDALTDRIQTLDPDVIEGHNLYNFDLPFLIERARRHGRTLAWGRDGSAPYRRGVQRFKAGARVIPFQGISIFGRHILDTYQQIQRYDTAGELQRYGLKEAIDALGLTRADRVFIPGDEIASVWRRDPERVIAYALDDVEDTRVLSELAAPTEFYQTQILPRAYQSVAVGGPGEKINFLMTRVYLSLGHSLPTPQPPRAYPGGYSEIRRHGVFAPVVKCDVESLYPAIMLTDRIAPASDALGVYLELLDDLTARRLQAKRQARSARGAERARWNGLQASFKVLINSFYGYLGYDRALFNDYHAAERVTLRGQEIIRRVVDRLERAGAEAIEIDTDGVYFCPPEGIEGDDEEEAFVASIAAHLPEGISLAHDGSFRGMISLKVKNYVLLTREGRLILKGSSLRSRRDEPIFRRFLQEVSRAFILGSHAEAREVYLRFAERILRREVPVAEIARSETVTEKTFASEANRRIAAAAQGERIGERLMLYQRADGSLGRIEEYAGDEDLAYLLDRLRDMAQRFRPLFPDSASFDYTFPPVSPRTDVADLRATLPVQQLPLFG